MEKRMCKVIITNYKASGKFYSREEAAIQFNSHYPMLEDNFNEKIITNNGLKGQAAITTFSWDGGDEVAFLEGAIIKKD